MALAFSPDGRDLIVGRGNAQAEVWSVSSGTIRQKLRSHERTVRDVDLAKEGRLLALSSYDGHISLWNREEGRYERIRRFDAHDGSVYSVAFSPDAKQLLSGGSDAAACLWTPSDNAEEGMWRRAQMADQVSLQLEEETDGRAPLPEGTAVLVLKEGRSGAQSLRDLGLTTGALRDRLLKRAAAAPEALLDTLEAKGKTTGAYTTGVLRYVIARTPEGTLYQSHVDEGPGFDLVASGNMRMRPVEEDSLKEVFETAITAATTARLRLEGEKGPLPENTAVRVWTRTDPAGNRPFSTAPSDSTRLGAEGQTEARFGRTWHTGRRLYVAARTPAGTLYESHVNGQAGFDAVETGRIAVARVPEDARERVGAAFVAPAGPGDWWGWLISGTLIGLIIGLGGAWGYYASKERELQRVKWKKNELAATLRQKESQSGAGIRAVPADDREQETVEHMRAKNDELRKEIAEMKEKVQKRDEELQHQESEMPPEEDERFSWDDPENQAVYWQEKARALEKTVEQMRQRLARSTLLPLVDETDPTAEISAGEDADRSSKVHSHSKVGSPSNEQDAGIQQIVEAYVAWCREGGAMVGRYYMFERRLQRRGIDGTVNPIYHDARTDDGFRRDVEDTSREFWLVKVDADTLLMPAPSSNDTFRVLMPAYDSDVQNPTVTALRDLSPARLHIVNGAASEYRLRQPGMLHVSSDHA